MCVPRIAAPLSPAGLAWAAVAGICPHFGESSIISAAARRHLAWRVVASARASAWSRLYTGGEKGQSAVLYGPGPQSPCRNIDPDKQQPRRRALSSLAAGGRAGSDISAEEGRERGFSEARVPGYLQPLPTGIYIT